MSFIRLVAFLSHALLYSVMCGGHKILSGGMTEAESEYGRSLSPQVRPGTWAEAGADGHSVCGVQGHLEIPHEGPRGA